MTTWIDFVELRARVSLEDVLLKMYGLGEKLKRQGDKLIGPCPVHGGDSERAFHAELNRNVWHCFTRCKKKGGNQLDLVALKEGISVREAALRVHSFFGLGESRPPSSSPSGGTPGTPAPSPEPAQAGTPAKPKDDGPINPKLDLKLELDPTHPHILKDRGLSVETAKRFGVGYCARGILRGMIAIPIRDEDGDLVAYGARRLKFADIKANGKYKFPKGFRRELVLYNLDRAKALSAEHGLIVVKGFFSVLGLYEAGIENVVAAMGCSLSEAQADLLAEMASSVTLLFDGDDSGRAGAEEARSRLAPRVPTSVIRLPDGFEPEGVPSKALRWAVNGTHALDLSDLAFGFRNPPKPREPQAPPEGGAP